MNHQPRGNDHDEATDSFSENYNPTRSLNPSVPICPSPGAISNLCSATLGAGALSLPYAFSLTGLVPGVLLLLLSGYLTILSIDVIISSCVHTKLYKYEDVALRLAGKPASRALEASLLIFCFGTAVAYIVAVGDIIDQGVRTVIQSGNDEQEDGLYTRERVMILYWLLVMFPLSLQRHMEGLERFSSLGVLSIIFLVLAAVIHSIEHGELIGLNDSDSEQKTINMRTMLWPDSIWRLIQAFPIIIFAFSCQVNVCAIFEELSPIYQDTSTVLDSIQIRDRMMKRITRSGITLCMTLYLAIGTFGYLDFAHETLDNILKNYNIPVTHDSLMIAASIFVAVAITVAYPFNILPARVTLKLVLDRIRSTKFGIRLGIISRKLCCDERKSRSSSTDDTSHSSPVVNEGVVSCNTDENHDGLEPLLFGENYEEEVYLRPLSLRSAENENNSPVNDPSTSSVEHFFLTLFLSGTALIVALLIPGISVIFGLMGGSAASVISFILPGLFIKQVCCEEIDLASSTQQNQMSISRMFIWGGVVIGVLSTGVTLYGLL